MEIHSEKFDLSDADVELLFRMINAEKAKEWINVWDYFKGNEHHECPIRPEDIKWLEKQCSYDFTVIPDKMSDDYPNWKRAVYQLCNMNLYIFDAYYGAQAIPYGIAPAEKISLDDRMRKWSECRHKDDAVVKELIDEMLERPSDDAKDKNDIARAIITLIAIRKGEK